MGWVKRIFWGKTVWATARRWLSIVALVFVVLAAFWYWRPVALEPPAIAMEGIDPEVAELITQGRDAVRQQPRSASTWGRLGMLLTAHNFNPEAMVCFARAELLDPKDLRWPYLQGVLLLTEDPEAAVRKLGRAVAIDSSNATVRLRLAETLLEQGQLDTAEGYFRQTLERAPADPRAHLGLARVAFARHDWAGCRQHLTYTAGCPQARKASHILLAEVQQRLGDKTAAAETARLAINMPNDPAWPDAIEGQVVERRVDKQEVLHRMLNLLREGRVEEARAGLAEHLQKEPEDVLSWTLLGQLYFRKKDFAAAEEAFQAAIRAKPEMASAHFYRGLVLSEQEKYSAAADCFRKAIHLQPGLGAAHQSLGRCLLHEGDRVGAIAAFRQAVQQEPQLAQGHFALAELLAREGQNAEALVHLRDALTLEPNHKKARELLNRIEKRGN